MLLEVCELRLLNYFNEVIDAYNKSKSKRIKIIYIVYEI